MASYKSIGAMDKSFVNSCFDVVLSDRTHNRLIRISAARVSNFLFSVYIVPSDKHRSHVLFGMRSIR